MEPEVKRIGRPPKVADPGTRVSLGLKVTAETKAQLESLARASGRTQSQEAEAAIERGRILGDLADAGPAVANVLQEMLRAASSTVDALGDPTASEEARDDLRKRWVQIAQSAFPDIAYPAPWEQAAKAAVSALRHAAIDARGKWLDGDRSAGKSVASCGRYLGQIATAQLYPGVSGWPAAETALTALAAEAGGDLADDVEAILSLARAAASAVRQAEKARK